MGGIWKTYKKISVFYKVLGGFVMGIVLGIVIGPPAANLQFLGLIMVRLVSMVVLPLVMSMIVVAVGDVGGKSVGKMGALSTIMFTLSSIIAIGIGFGFAFIFNVGYGIEPDVAWEITQAAAAPTVMDTIINVVPNNIFAALTSADLMQVLAFSIFVGAAITMMPNKKHSAMLIDVFSAVGDVMQKVLSFVMGFMPIGVMGIMAWLIGTQGLGAILEFAPFIGAILATTVVLHLGVHTFLFAFLLGRVPMGHFLKSGKEPALFAWATNSSYATLPVAMTAAQKMGISDKIRNFIIPYGIVVNMDGTAAYLGVATIFIANVYGIQLDMTQLIMIVATATLGSFGAAGVPGAAVVMLSAVLAMLDLPQEAVVLLLGFDRLIPGPARTVNNINGDLAVASIVQRFVEKTTVKKPEDAALVEVEEETVR
ncbi:MAG: dicarboxylate/amino acid:cation symporter [Oscillospiraceae bacterium]|nr:dicarboxylate/amino acid:cation symporter [Oscillospiraceae bacterium]